EGDGAAPWLYAQAGALLWRPDPTRMPGIRRIELLCDEDGGSGITAAAVRKLRARLCRDTHSSLHHADRLALNPFADRFRPSAPPPYYTTGVEKRTDYDEFWRGTPFLGTVRVGTDRYVPVTGVSCKVVPGTTATTCPNADPPASPSAMKDIDGVIRET